MRVNKSSGKRKGLKNIYWEGKESCMPTKKPIISFPVEEDFLKRIDDYRRSIEGPIPPRTEAIRRLLEEALSKYEKKSKK